MGGRHIHQKPLGDIVEIELKAKAFQKAVLSEIVAEEIKLNEIRSLRREIEQLNQHLQANFLSRDPRLMGLPYELLKGAWPL